MFGIGKTATGVANASVAIPIRNIDSQIERAIQRETSTRKRIQAEVDKVKIKEKYKTARAKTYNELGYRYINESDQIMTAYDNHFLEAHIKLKKGGRAHVRLSPLNMTYLMAMVFPLFGDNPVSLPQLAQQNRLTLYNLIDKMEFMARTATQQGDTSFTLPPGWGESPNELNPVTPPPIEPDEQDPWKDRSERTPLVKPQLRKEPATETDKDAKLRSQAEPYVSGTEAELMAQIIGVYWDLPGPARPYPPEAMTETFDKVRAGLKDEEVLRHTLQYLLEVKRDVDSGKYDKLLKKNKANKKEIDDINKHLGR